MSEIEQDTLAATVAERVVAKLREDRDERPLLSAKQVAARLGITEKPARVLINGKVGQPPKLASIKVGGSRKVEPAELDRYIASLRGDQA